MREIEVPMPKLSMTMEEGELIAWVKQEGEQVRAGDVIAEVNSDKVEMEVESPADGTLVRHTATKGDVIPVGAPIATLATEAEDLLGGILGPADGDGGDGAATAGAPSSTAEAAADEEKTAAETETARAVGATPAAPAAGRAPVVPAARRRAAELGVDLATVTGTGGDGLVRVDDVEAAAAAGVAAAGAVDSRERAGAGAARLPLRGAEPGTGTVQATPAPAGAADGEVAAVPLSAMRRTVARRLVESMQSTPHFYLTSTVDAEALLELRAELNRELADRADDLKVSVNDLIVKACAGLLRTTPDLNVSWGGDKLLLHKRVHVGIAVALDGGLIVPVIRDADTKALTQIAREAKELVGRAREGRLAAGELTGGTFTVSNLGMYGIDQFTAVINPPEAAILAVGAAVAEPVATAEGAVVVHRRMRLTLSIDHRALDGATGAGFLAQLKHALEHPLQIIA